MQSLNDGLECASVAHSTTTLTRGATSPLENQEALAYLNTVSVWYFAVFNGKAFCTGFVTPPLIRGGWEGYFAPDVLNVENTNFSEN
ncbi:hypothetical protein EEJ34_16935 [Vibrio cholerae]|nr:hypothetical protein EEJ34_16935 [Vibrio cholerae]